MPKLVPATPAPTNTPPSTASFSTGLLKSKGEARRMIRQNAVRVNGTVVSDEMHSLTSGDVQDGRIALQVGKKRHHHLLVS